MRRVVNCVWRVGKDLEDATRYLYEWYYPDIPLECFVIFMYIASFHGVAYFCVTIA